MPYFHRFLISIGLLLLAPTASAQPASDPPTPAVRDASHDFDFETGAWHAHIHRLKAPLTGSTTWVDYDGSSVVRPVWGGKANLGELDVVGPGGRITGLSLRLYDPVSGQWNISWANTRDGTLTTPLIGGFTGGRGEFYDQEMFDGRSIYARFLFSGMTSSHFRIEQAFSADGGKNWETNWIADFSR